MSRVKDKLIRLQKEYASYGEYDGVYVKEVQEMIDELLADLHEGRRDPCRRILLPGMWCRKP